ncbi:hypothetical protein ATE84_4256 [Aquimarina sp. MAR_2010_214]|nr:hypothetical protein ATE84_4256 [Aquimarina sp. MAR_2010_214]
MAFDYPGEKLKNYKSNLETQTHVLVVRVENKLYKSSFDKFKSAQN